MYRLAIRLPSPGVRRTLLLLALAALTAPASAAAHARLLATVPANGSVLARAPAEVRVTFDDTVTVGSGNAAVDNATRASVLAGRPITHGRTLVLRLRALARGDYTVRWGIVSADGHPEEGVLAFAVGTGSGRPEAVLAAHTPLSGVVVSLKTIFYLGLLVAGGAAAFLRLAVDVLGDRLRRPLAHLLFFGLLAAFVGGGGLIGETAGGTRFAHVLGVAVVVAAVAAAAAALAPIHRRLLPVAAGGALLLLVAPTLSGHALDPDQPRLIAVPVDLAHLVAAAVWLGGLVSLAFVLPRTAATDSERARVVRRFSSTALAAVCVLAASGVGRALTELTAMSQVWTTTYGRLLIVKTALFAGLVATGWWNRTVLVGLFSRLRRSMLAEIVLLAGVVVAVATLTQQRPGAAEAGRPPRRAAVPAPPVLPPPGAVVDAAELGDLAVAVARMPGAVTVTLLSGTNDGISGRVVLVDGRRAEPCGSGCYRAPAEGRSVKVTVGRRALAFRLDPRAPDATARLAALTARYEAQRSVVFDERLASTPTDAVETVFTLVAPDRLAYTIRGGPAAVVIGARRWDRATPKGRYVESQTTPLTVPRPYWSEVTNVHEVAPGVLTFLDRELPAWFRVTIAGGLPHLVRMTAAAHFMVDRYRSFDGPAAVSPPSR